MFSKTILFIFFITFSFCNQSSLDYEILANNDTDGDGYTDLQEEHFGSNPNDVSSLIYKGGWPYNVDKDYMPYINFKDCSSIPYGNGCQCTEDSQCMEGSKCEILFTSQNCVPKQGAQLPRFIGIDQFGDNVDLYDFANQEN